jgi:endo-1,4-beta-D-glucanase Y
MSQLMLPSLTLASTLLVAEPLASAGRPFPQHVVYPAGTIRPSHRTQSQQDDDVRSYYEDWKRNYLLEAGALADGRTLYRISIGKTNPARTVSEGQGYGMIIVAVMAGNDPDAQTLFDGLWNFSRQYPSMIDSRLMGFQVPVKGNNSNSAFDGDCDIAYALLLADAQWGSGGAVRYKNEALTVIAGILASTIGPNSRLPMLGDWVRSGDAAYSEYTPRSSDFMPGHFRSFGKATGDPVWTEVLNATQSVITSLQTHYSALTGLLPDFIVTESQSDKTPAPAPPGFLEGPNDGDYDYNAGRDPWRLGTDALLNGDPLSMVQTRKITRWARAAAEGDPAQIRGGYRLDGTPLPGSDYFSIFFAAPLAVAAMTDAEQQQWLNDLYDSVYARHEDYYEDSVTLLSLLTLTGNMWSPDSEPGRRPKRRAVRR